MKGVTITACSYLATSAISDVGLYEVTVYELIEIGAAMHLDLLRGISMCVRYWMPCESLPSLKRCQYHDSGILNGSECGLHSIDPNQCLVHSCPFSSPFRVPLPGDSRIQE